jgi:hypothetical protein
MVPCASHNHTLRCGDACGCLLSGFACSDRQRRGGGLTAFGESLDGHAGVEERAEERGQWEVGGADLALAVTTGKPSES